MKNEINGKKIKIVSSNNHQNWYSDKIGQTFIAQSFCSKNKDKIIVRTTIDQAGWKYGWVEKTDCELVS